jgi:hypothetical protein
MPQFIYILGAGASAEVIPTVRDFSKEMFEFKPIGFIKGQELNLYNKIVNSYAFQDAIKAQEANNFMNLQIQNKFLHFAQKFETFGSPDIYAKHLFINNFIDDLKELKFFLSLFIQICEYLNRNGSPDQRYFEFAGQLCNNHSKMPSNVTILSWNYDNQMELAQKKYFNNKEWGTNASKESSKNNELKVFKINGGAFFNENNIKKHLTTILPHENSKMTMFTDLKLLFQKKDYLETGIMFSFEKENDIIDNIMEKLSIDDDIYLTTIGYSFPVYNREIDRKILSKLVEKNFLKRIYIQDPNPIDIQRKIIGFFPESFSIHIKNLCEHIQATYNDLNQPFHIPLEFQPQY